MDLSNLKPPKGAKHSKKRVGRGHGSGQGTQAGRGHKGAQSRSGYKRKVGFEGGQMPLKRRVPKRGFHNPFRVEYAVVNLDTLAERFDAGTVVTLDLLRERRLVPPSARRVKVLGPRRDREGAHRARAQVQRQGGEEDCGCRRCGGDARAWKIDSEVSRKWKVKSRKSHGYRQRQESVCRRRAAEARALHAWACWSCIASAVTSRLQA